MTHSQRTWSWKLGIVIVAGGAIAFGDCAKAQITPDVSLGAESSTVTNLDPESPVDVINGGAIRGANLFHSFREFNVGEGRGAYFSNPTGVENILGRVTGTNASTILGTLGVLGNANLFLINPNGIIFGPNSHLDIRGSFVGSTASSLNFADGTQFRATAPQPEALLTVSVPIGLQFGSNPGGILVQGDGQGVRTTTDLIDTDAGLRVASDQTLALVGGDLTLLGATLKTAGGQIELGSVADSSLVSLTSAEKGWNFGYEGVQNFRDIQSQQAAVDASGAGGGNIQLSGRRVTITDGSRVEATTLGSEPGGTLAVNASESVVLSGEGQFPSALIAAVYPGATGNGGNLTINTAQLVVRDGAYASTATLSSGNAGTLSIHATDSVDLSGTSADASFFSGLFTTSLDVGAAGNLTINTGQLTVRDGAGMIAGAVDTGTGAGGNLVVNATNTSLTNRAFVSVAARTGGSIAISTQNLDISGNSFLSAGIGTGIGSIGSQAGNITLNARGAITVREKSSIGNTVQNQAVGKGGDINIRAGSLALTDGAQLRTGTFGEGDAGNISIQADGSVNLTDSLIVSTVDDTAVGQGGDISIQAESLALMTNTSPTPTGLNASTLGRGDAGNVFIQVDNSVSLTNNSAIYTSVSSGAVGEGGNITIGAGSLSLTKDSQLGANTYGQGNAGNIAIETNGAVSLANDSYISSSVDTSATGNGGEIDIKAGLLSLANGSALSTTSLAEGKAGNLSLQIDSSISLAASKIFSFGATGGEGGNVTISSEALSLTDTSSLDTSTYGQGDAGNVDIQTSGAISLANSTIFSSVNLEGVGKGGNVNIHAGSFSLSDEAVLSTSTYGQGDAGSVFISTSGPVSLTSGSFISSDVTSPSFVDEVGPQPVGNGGDINIQAESLSLDEAALTTSTSGRGDAGNVSINTNGPVLLTNEGFIVSSVTSPAFIDKVGPEAVGNGGNIKILAQSLFLDRSRLGTGTAGQGNSGTISVQTNDFVSLASGSLATSAVQEGGVGNGGDISIQTRVLSLANGSRLGSGVVAGAKLPGGRGDGGDILINATEAVNFSGVAIEEYSDGVFDNVRGYSSGLFTNTGLGTIGQTGDITVNTDTFRIADGAVISARTSNASEGGSITINANTFAATGGAQVLTYTRSSGQAGDISLNVRDRVTLSGSDPSFANRLAEFGSDVVINESAASGLFANTSFDSTGNGGSISIDPRQFNITDGAVVSVNSQGQGNAGTLSVQAGSLTLNRGAFSAETASGEGGNIKLQVQDLLQMRHNSRISAEAGGTGNGGNIDLNTQFLLAVPSENSDIIANAFEGNGGRVQIAAQGIFGTQFRELQTSQSDITASSRYGVNGVVEINTPDVNPSRGLVNVPVEPANTEVVQSCQAGGRTEKSEFVVTGRGGLPAGPSEALSSDAVQVDWVALDSNGKKRSIEPTHQTSPTPAPLVEAQGWVVGPQGEVTLTASAPSTPHSLWQTPASCRAAQRAHS